MLFVDKATESRAGVAVSCLPRVGERGQGAGGGGARRGRGKAGEAASKCERQKAQNNFSLSLFGPDPLCVTNSLSRLIHTHAQEDTSPRPQSLSTPRAPRGTHPKKKSSSSQNSHRTPDAPARGPRVPPGHSPPCSLLSLSLVVIHKFAAVRPPGLAEGLDLLLRHVGARLLKGLAVEGAQLLEAGWRGGEGKGREKQGFCV